MEMLNSIPGVVINGEHNAELWSLLSVMNHATAGLYGSHDVDKISGFGDYSKLHENKALQKRWAEASQSATDTAAAKANVKPLLCYSQWFVRHLLNVECTSGRMHGFKEIRYASTHMIKLLRDLFPCGKFVLNYRDVEAQSHSSWWAKRMHDDKKAHTNGTMDELVGMVDALMNFHVDQQHRDKQGRGGGAGDGGGGGIDKKQWTDEHEVSVEPLSSSSNTFLLPLESFTVR
jgi:hypothetical protein